MIIFKYLSLFTLCLLSSQSLFALSLEELNENFITDPTPRSLTVLELERLEAALFDIGHIDYWNRLEEKLNLTDKAAIGQYIRSCELEIDLQGTYQRGGTQSYTQGLVFGMDPERPELIFDRPDILSAIENSYRWQAENNGPYVSLVIQNWPIICIRPGMRFGRALAVFVHELEHYLGDEYLPINPDNLIDEETFIQSEFRRSGGEYNAFLAGNQVSIDLAQKYGWLSYNHILSFFSEDGTLTDEQGFESHILYTLNYIERFKNKYQTALQNFQTQNQHKRNLLISLKELFAYNKGISESNIRVAQNNLLILERNKSIYQRYNQLQQLRQVELDLELQRQQLESNQASFEFNTRMLEMTEQMLEEN